MKTLQGITILTDKNNIIIGTFYGLILLLCTSCSLFNPTTKDAEKLDEFTTDSNETWKIPQSTIKGVALVVHGLNLQPRKMDPLCDELRKIGFASLRISLAGHGKGENKNLSISAQTWIDQVDQAKRKIDTFSSKHNVSKIYLGYSLGGLLGLVTMLKSDQQTYDKVILFAPAISLHWFTKLMKSTYLLGQSFSLPSMTPKEYAANTHLTVAFYRGLFDLYEQFHSQENYQNINQPTKIFISPKDELISKKGIDHFLTKEKLNNWETISSSSQNSKLEERYEHLIIDRPSVGAEQWSLIIERDQVFPSTQTQIELYQ